MSTMQNAEFVLFLICLTWFSWYHNTLEQDEVFFPTIVSLKETV